MFTARAMRVLMGWSWGVALAALALGPTVTPANASKPDVFTFPVEFELVYDDCGFPVLNTGSAVDEIAVHYDRGGLEKMYIWHRAGSLSYTNLETGETIQGSFRRRINRHIDAVGTLNPDGSTTFSQSDHGVRHSETLPGIGTIFRHVGLTELEFTFDTEGGLIKAVSDFHGVIDEDAGLPPKLCAALE